MKKLMIVAAFGLVFSVLSVMPAKADSPKKDARYENHDRRDIRNDRRDIRNDRRDIREDRRDVRFDRHESFHHEYRPVYHCR